MLSDDVKKDIQSAYSQFLESNQWQPRLGQKQMIAEIARTVGGVSTDSEGKREESTHSHVCVVEAGTGTGKTIAYCLGAIPLAKFLKKTLIISTGTVALQEQIVLKDLPDISRHAGLSFSFALAKGRSRYLCPAKLDVQLEGAMVDPTLALYPDEVPEQNDEATLKLFQEMLDQLASGKWDGDRDAWAQHIDNMDWVKVTTDHNQCAGRRCAYITQCPFFKAREAIHGVDVVVANHDLVLADLSLGGGAVLPEPEEAIYIFDEGHHLADKAVQHFAFHSRMQGTIKWLKQSEKTVASMAKALADITGLGTTLEKITGSLSEAESALQHVNHYLSEVIEFPEPKRGKGKNSDYKISQRYRYPFGVVPEDLRVQAENLKELFLRLSGFLSEVVSELRETLDDEHSAIPKHEVELWYPSAGTMLARAEASYGLWRSFAVEDKEGSTPTARWITLRDESGLLDFEVCSSPIQSANTLQSSLWDRAFAAVLTSATLTALNSFDRLKQQAGTPDSASYLSIQSPFDFQNAVLSVPALSMEPSDTEAHTRAIVEFVEEDLDKNKGNLVLFSSRKQMEDVFYALEKSLQKVVLLQGDLSKQEMIREHKKCIDAGNGSILFGLASFAEGVDLPGKYCEHVVIAKIPFAVPDDPIEEAVAEWVEQRGGNSFMEISVPDASMKMIQACGRLLRNEKDSGRITLMDRRVVTKRYGKMLLDSLPPFRRDIA